MIESTYSTLKTKDHFDNFVTGGTVPYRSDKLRFQQWWESCQNDDLLQCLKQAVTHSLNSTWSSGERPQIVCGPLKICMVI